MIRIAHLYPYELDLYGENGNIKALTFMLKENNIPFEVINIDIDDEINFYDYDFIYIGSGRKGYLDLVRDRLKSKKEEILKYISQEKVLLVTGNAINVFDFLGLYEVEYQKTRKISNVVGTTSLCKGIIKGFQNTEYLINKSDNILFTLDEGYGLDDTGFEGFKEKNFYATSVIGPLLARNDNFCKYIMEQILTMKED